MSAIAPRDGIRHWPQALLVALVVLAYLNAFGNRFVWDDVVLIENNPAIKSWRAALEALTSDILPGAGRGDYYRPLQMLSYRLDHAIWRLDPLGFHLTSILLHAAAAVLFYQLALLLLADSRAAALAAAALWAVHPAHTAAVTYLSGRADPIAAVLVLVSLLAFARRREARFSAWRGLSLAAAFLALLARESALILPLLVVLVDRALDHQGRSPAAWRARILWRYLPYLGVVLLYWGLRLATIGPAAGAGATAGVPLGLRLLTMLKTVVAYLAFLLVPLDPHMERRVLPAGGLFEPRVVGAVLLVGVLGVIAWRHRRTPLGWGIAWFFVALLPVSNLVPLATFMAEHWLYLPSMGLFLAAGWGLGRLADAGWRQPVAAFLLLAVAAFGALTMRRNRDWRDARTIFTATARAAPWSARAWSNLGNAHLQAGELEAAHAALQRALALYGDGAREAVRAHHYLGVLERQRGRPERAMEQFRQALAIEPGDALVHSEVALSLAAAGDDEAARRAFETALALEPQAAVIHSNYGNHLFRRGELEPALARYREAVRLDPDFSAAYNNLGSAYFRLGKAELAIAAYSEALRLNPGLDEARRNLQVVRDALAAAPSAAEQER
jgi:tetratricopeptide (TPR) repeat protein